eukprot:1180282-Pyramimonas_sp.AAC.1
MVAFENTFRFFLSAPAYREARSLLGSLWISDDTAHGENTGGWLSGSAEEIGMSVNVASVPRAFPRSGTFWEIQRPLRVYSLSP